MQTVVPFNSFKLLVALLMLLTFAGCKPPMRSVVGTVLLDGEPIGNCKVGFFPDTTEFNPDRHGFGFRMTDEKGDFKIQHPQGEEGIWAGKYKVTFVAWVNNAGKSLPMDIKPSEVSGGVKNRFPDKYEAPSTSPESVTVTSGENVFKFDIKTK